MTLTHRLLGLGAALMLGLSACQNPNGTQPVSSDPNANKVLFTQVEQADANTTDFTAELVTGQLAPAPGQDFLTINIARSLADNTRLLSVTLRTSADQIKTGATFPFGRDGGLGTAVAIYQERVSIVTQSAYQASSGTLVIDKVSGFTNLTVEFHIKDAKMEPANTTSGTLNKGSFVINMHGLPTR